MPPGALAAARGEGPLLGGYLVPAHRDLDTRGMGMRLGRAPCMLIGDKEAGLHAPQ